MFVTNKILVCCAAECSATAVNVNGSGHLPRCARRAFCGSPRTQGWAANFDWGKVKSIKVQTFDFQGIKVGPGFSKVKGIKVLMRRTTLKV